MRVLVAVAVLTFAPSAWADERCAPHVRLEGGDVGLLDELSRSLEARGIRTTALDTDEAWGCEELVVQVALEGPSLTLTARDGTGHVHRRTVRATGTAVSLMESWLMRGVGVALPGSRATWWLAVRGEGAGAKHARWDAGVSATLDRDMWRDVLHLELTLRATLGSREELSLGPNGFSMIASREPVGGVSLLCGPALRLGVGRAAVWLGAAGGLRVVLAAEPLLAPVLEPMVALTLPLEYDVELELRSSFDVTMESRPNGSLDDHWVVRGAVGLRWGVR